MASDSAAATSRITTRLAMAELLRPLYRNGLVLLGTVIVMVIVGLAIAADVVAPRDPLEIQVSRAIEGPSGEYLFGTDRFGRDVLSRVVHGSRISLWVGLASVSASLLLGVSLGLLSGYFGSWMDHLNSRLMDVLFSFPTLLLAIAVAAMLGPGIENAILAIIVVYTPVFSRVARGSTLAERQREYVQAAMLVGARHLRIVTRHILPNIAAPVIVQASISMSHAILVESYLSYLGLGTQPPAPSWGTMLSEGRTFLEIAPWMSIFPGLAIMATVLAFNILGDGLRDALDPRLR